MRSLSIDFPTAGDVAYVLLLLGGIIVTRSVHAVRASASSASACGGNGWFGCSKKTSSQLGLHVSFVGSYLMLQVDGGRKVEIGRKLWN